MFALGHIHFKNYTVWVTTTPFGSTAYQQGADELPYYEVKITKKEQPTEDSSIPKNLLYNFYVDIATHPIFKTLLKLNDRNQPIEDVTDMVEYQSYLDRKSCSQPIYKLSRSSVERLLDLLSKDNLGALLALS